MFEHGPIVASGRDADIFEYGPNLVLRRSRTERSHSDEAATMQYLLDAGYPVPRIHDMSSDGRDLIMERIAGVTMLGAIEQKPWMVRRYGSMLADLHHQLHKIAAPPEMGKAPIGIGTQIVHLDLHPLNVMISPSGPVVIDWTNARSGSAAVDVALAWVLMAGGQVDTGWFMTRATTLVRAQLIRAFLASFDREEIAAELRDVVTWKVRDAHLTESETSAMWSLVSACELKMRSSNS